MVVSLISASTLVRLITLGNEPVRMLSVIVHPSKIMGGLYPDCLVTEIAGRYERGSNNKKHQNV